MSIKQNIDSIKLHLPKEVTLIAVTKTYPPEIIQQAYDAGHKIFGENKVQEMVDKYEVLPKDIEWHLIGHLQSNKVKYIAPFVTLIHSVDSLKLLEEINKQAVKNNRVIECLLQIYIASEDTKFGLSFSEAEELIESNACKQLHNIKIVGFMGMASNTNDQTLVKTEFSALKHFFNKFSNFQFTTLSMGMSSDYPIAINCGSNMIRVGSAIFGDRNYSH